MGRGWQGVIVSYVAFAFFASGFFEDFEPPWRHRNQVLFRRVDDCIYAFGKKAQGQWTCLGRYVPPRGVNIEFVINAQEGTLSG